MLMMWTNLRGVSGSSTYFGIFLDSLSHLESKLIKAVYYWSACIKLECTDAHDVDKPAGAECLSVVSGSSTYFGIYLDSSAHLESKLRQYYIYLVCNSVLKCGIFLCN